MKKRILIGMVIVAMAFSFFLPTKYDVALANDREAINGLIASFFEALENGDTKGILGSLADPLLSKRKNLLQKNPNYSKILADVYRDVEITFGDVVTIRDNEAKVNFKIKLQDGTISQKQFLCKRNNGFWKISDEINIQ